MTLLSKTESANIIDIKFINERFVESFLLSELDVEFDSEKISFLDPSKKYTLNDSTPWDDRKSFREGKLVIDVGYPLELEGKNDYVITILGYTIKGTKIDPKNHIIVSLNYDDAFVNSMKRLAAIDDFIRTRTHFLTMQSKRRMVIDGELKPLFAKALSEAEITFQGKTLNVQDD